MVNSYKRAEDYSVPALAKQSAIWAISAQGKIQHFVVTAHRTFLALGLAAITLLAVMFVKPDLADQIFALSPFAEKTAEDAPEALQAVPAMARMASVSTAATVVAKDLKPTLATQPAIVKTAAGGASTDYAAKLQAMTTDAHALPVTDSQQKRVINWIAKRYRVAGDAASMMVAHTYQTAKEIKLDPLLILAVMAIESGFNPYAESPVGAQGLMQVMSKVHHDKFKQVGGAKAALNPLANIKVGALILKDYVTRTGSVEGGLKVYVGAGASDNDSGYGAKVLAEYRRLKDVAGGKNVPVVSPSASSNTVTQKQRQIEPALPKNEVAEEAALEEEPLPLSQREHHAVL